MTEKDKAEAYAEVLALGFVRPDEVVSWIDTVILKVDSVTEPMIDGSLSTKKPNDLISYLHQFPGEADRTRVVLYVFGHMRNALRRDPTVARRIASHLYRMVVDGRIPDPTAESEMYSFDDDFELTRQGVLGDETKVRRELEDFLERHSEAAG